MNIVFLYCARHVGYFLQYFTVSIRFHVIGRHRPFGSANSNKNVPTYVFVPVNHCGFTCNTYLIRILERGKYCHVSLVLRGLFSVIGRGTVWTNGFFGFFFFLPIRMVVQLLFSLPGDISRGIKKKTQVISRHVYAALLTAVIHPKRSRCGLYTDGQINSVFKITL